MLGKQVNKLDVGPAFFWSAFDLGFVIKWFELSYLGCFGVGYDLDVDIHV